MATGGAIKTIHTTTKKASVAVTGGKIVKQTANENEVAIAAAATDVIDGVTLEDQATVGEGVAILKVGEAWITAGAAVAIDALITSDATGRGVTAAPAAGVNNWIIGKAEQAASGAGKDFRVSVNPQRIQG